jgi:hypothetical protein
MAASAAGRPHLSCPYCEAYEVDRLFLATHRLDACQCRACGEGWDEERVVRRRTVRMPLPS